MQVYPKSYCIQHKTKRYSFHSCRLMFIFCQHRQHSCRMAFSLLESVRRIAPPMRIDFHHAILSEKLLHSRKAKRYSFHPYRLTFIFSQHRRHGCHMAFSLLESMHGIISPASSLSSCCISHKTKAVQFPPYRLMFIFSQHRRHDCHMAFSLLESVHRIAPPASSLFGKLLHPRKAKRYSFHPYRLMFIFCQRRRHDCHMAFSLLESVHRIAPPMRTHGR